MVLEYMGGGELFHWLKQHRKFSEPRGKLYAAEICLALEALHSRDIIYRDLKVPLIKQESAPPLGVVDSPTRSVLPRCLEWRTVGAPTGTSVGSERGWGRRATLGLSVDDQRSVEQDGRARATPHLLSPHPSRPC